MANEITNLSGAPISTAKKVTMTLEYDMSNAALGIGGQVGNLDLALNMLAQATRHLKSQYRNAKAMEYRNAMIEGERLSRLVNH